MKDLSIKELSLFALFTALVVVATMSISIPMIGTQGYVNIGDTMIFVTALLLGTRAGVLAGGIGSALADIFLGYFHWAPWTLLIKGIEGLIVGVIGHASFAKHKRITLRSFLSLLVAVIWMVMGYYFAGGVMVGFSAAVSSVPGNLIQGGAGIVLSIPLVYLLRNLINRDSLGR